jgi:hypothetical protein
MTTDELIRALRKMAEKFMRRNDELPFLLNHAADRLEKQEERISIMAAEMDETWGNKP